MSYLKPTDSCFLAQGLASIPATWDSLFLHLGTFPMNVCVPTTIAPITLVAERGGREADTTTWTCGCRPSTLRLSNPQITSHLH